MTDESKPRKKVVSATSGPADQQPASPAPSAGWKPTPEAKAKAGQFRAIAWIGWLLAIALEVVLIFWVLRQNPVNMWLLIGGIVVIGVLASVASVVWKKANRLDPASREDTVRFFVQNQLGAIMSIIAFVPLIILIFTNKNMDGKQKAVAGGIGVIVAAVATLVFGVDWAPPSQEQYASETAAVTSLNNGTDVVYWVKGGEVFHLCETASDIQRRSKDDKIYKGTVAEAHAAGKARLTQKWESEATKQCTPPYTTEQVEQARAAMDKASELTDKEKQQRQEQQDQK